MNTRTTTAAALCAAALLALTACTTTTSGSASSSETKATPKTSASKKHTDPTKLDDAGKLACDDFAHGYKAADTRQKRLDLAHKVNKWAPSSKTNRIADTGKVLSNGANGSDGSWQIAADTFATACLDAGWTA
ncbi:hypothetical protein [Streptomyces sp. JNUCC 63]